MTVEATPRKAMQEYISERVEFEAMTGCWLWSRALGSKGYGQSQFEGRAMGAHRLSWLAFKGGEAGKMFVCHRCDTPSCVNPDHLFLGSASDNLADMDRKGRRRSVSGERASWSKITDAQAHEIARQIRAGRRHTDVAADVGCSLSTVSRIAKGAAWLHASGGPARGNNRGERHGFSKLTEAEVRAIRKLHADGIPPREIVLRFSYMAPSTVRGVIYRSSWRHVQ
jgi:hypothetical protein